MTERPPSDAPGNGTALRGAAGPADPRGGADLDAEVRRADEARWLASRFAPPDARVRLVALYAFHHEVARVREVVSDPIVGEIRLAWWREALAEIYEDPGRARPHPVVLALAGALAEGGTRPPRGMLDALIDARLRDLDETSFKSVDEVAAYAEATAGGLVEAAAWLLGERGERAEGLRAAGRAWGLAGLARAFPAHAARGWTAVPSPPSPGRLAAILEARDAAAVRELTAPLRARAGEALGEARARLRGAPAELWPAYGYVTLAGPALRRLGRADADPFALADRRASVADRARLVLAAARGGI